MLSKYPQRPQPDPLISHVQFLDEICSMEPFQICVKEASRGARVSVLHIELQKKDKRAAPGSFRTCTFGILTMGNLSTEKGPSLPTRPSIPQHELPDRERECEEYPAPEWLRAHAPVIFKGGSQAVKGFRGAAMNPRFGRNVREKWCRRMDADGFNVLSLGCILDSVRALRLLLRHSQADIALVPRSTRELLPKLRGCPIRGVVPDAVYVERD
jgi:hypothetical protein